MRCFCTNVPVIASLGITYFSLFHFLGPVKTLTKKDEREKGSGNSLNDIVTLQGATLPEIPVISHGRRDYSSGILLKMNRDA